MCMRASGERPTTESVVSAPSIPTNVDVSGVGPVLYLRGGEALGNAVCGEECDSLSGVNGWSVVGDPIQQLPIFRRFVEL